LISSMVESTIGNNCDKTTTHSISMSPWLILSWTETGSTTSAVATATAIINQHCLPSYKEKLITNLQLVQLVVGPGMCHDSTGLHDLIIVLRTTRTH
jgi:hypothetical protein